jgi:hypothetical protein
LWQKGRLSCECAAKKLESSICLRVHCILADQNIAEDRLQKRVVELRITFISVCRDNEDPHAVTNAQPDPTEPTFNFILFLPLAGIPSNHIKSSSAEEELVANSINLLTTKVPDMQCQSNR